MVNDMSDDNQQQCSYCKQWYPEPVNLHHSQEECDANQRTEDAE